MTWKAHKLIYKAASPIRMGHHTLGYINLTRYYITGRAMWGAMTANLTRANGSDDSDYKYFGDLMKKYILISYFYPAMDTNNPMLPKFSIGSASDTSADATKDKAKKSGWRYGTLPQYEFEQKFVKSMGQTAILPDQNSAEDKSLHESEFLSNQYRGEGKDKKNNLYDLYFVGYIFIKERCGMEIGGSEKTETWNSGDANQINLKKSISTIFVGGDRKYGYGKLLLLPDLCNNEPTDFFGFSLLDNVAQPCITIHKGEAIPAHLSVDSGLELSGDIEPLTSREWSDGGAGQKIKQYGEGLLFWVPGSTLLIEKSLKIGKYGILSL